MRPRTLSLAGAAALSLAVVSGSFAQPEPEPPTWLEVRTMTVDAGCMDAWRDVQKNVVSPALEKAGVPWREAWRTANFGTSREYTFVTPIESFAHYDDMDRIQIPEHALALLGSCNLDHRVQALILQEDLSKMRDASAPPKVAIVTVERLAPGKREEWQALMQSEVLPAMKKAPNTGYHVLQNVFGGVVEFVSVDFRDTLGEIDEGPMIWRALGREAGQEVASKRRALRTHTERWIARYDPELSFASGSTAER